MPLTQNSITVELHRLGHKARLESGDGTSTSSAWSQTIINAGSKEHILSVF
jgi:hypothetical protein